MAKSSGMEVPLTTRTRLDYEHLIAEGFSEDDISALYRLKTNMFKE